MSDSQFRVLIVGGGVGGLCLAQGLRRAGISVTVYERDRSLDARLQGYRLNLDPAGSQALNECLPPELWETLVATAGNPGPGMGVFTEQLHELMHENSNSNVDDPARGTHAVSRVTLRRLLLAGLDDVVCFGKEFVKYEQHADGTVTAHFRDGTSATGEVLVGADGARSRVRGQLLPDATSGDVPGIGVGGRLPLTPQTMAWLPEQLASCKNMVLPRKDFLFTAVFRRREDPQVLALRLGDRLQAHGIDSAQLLHESEQRDYIMWAFVAHRGSLPADMTNVRQRALQHLIEQRVRGWHPDLRRLIAESDTDTVDWFGFTAAARVDPWTTTNVTVLGDAIHCMPPVGGLGGNAALHDAQLLCRALTTVHRGESSLLPALHSYEAQMLKAGFGSVREALLYTRLAIMRSHVVRTVARAFFRFCGAVPPVRRAIFEND